MNLQAANIEAERQPFSSKSIPSVPSSSHAVLEELFRLLEDFSPQWYTEEHRNRVVAALGGPVQGMR
jgi:hypothetical protein